MAKWVLGKNQHGLTESMNEQDTLSGFAFPR
uniref:Uncharacterized protein n=1 Tax=Rhizophora mucronata TaxID=61149 RepID=A0A2P2QJB8_RHIMU